MQVVKKLFLMAFISNSVRLDLQRSVNTRTSAPVIFIVFSFCFFIVILLFSQINVCAFVTFV